MCRQALRKRCQSHQTRSLMRRRPGLERMWRQRGWKRLLMLQKGHLHWRVQESQTGKASRQMQVQRCWMAAGSQTQEQMSQKKREQGRSQGPVSQTPGQRTQKAHHLWRLRKERRRQGCQRQGRLSQRQGLRRVHRMRHLRQTRALRKPQRQVQRQEHQIERYRLRTAMRLGEWTRQKLGSRWQGHQRGRRRERRQRQTRMSHHQRGRRGLGRQMEKRLLAGQRAAQQGQMSRSSRLLGSPQTSALPRTC
mmetsp:Transcript_10635/g.29108  ORF Transcript_10635/g.29108 Transcript_10635/m.29108 type:complete len:250 (+) Transcript_10635:3574-4323(+)